MTEVEKITLADKTLEEVFNYLHWNADNLSGDDLIGDGRLTRRYEEVLKRISDTLVLLRGKL